MWSPVGVMGFLQLPHALAWQSDSCWSGGIGLGGRGWKGMEPASDLGFNSPTPAVCRPVNLSCVSDLPYGWEQETDENGQVYFVE